MGSDNKSYECRSPKSNSALESINQARNLLIKAININPTALHGSAYVTLGSLYYLTPKWPIGFANEENAKQMLKTALQINPNGIESNYYYGEFLLSLEKLNEAERYLKRAIELPSRAEQEYGDNQLKNQARTTLNKTLKIKASRKQNLFTALFNYEKN